MDKIQPKEYVRTVDGKIGIFDKYSSRPETSIYKSPFDCFIRLKNRKTPLQCCRDYIVKHSNDIIDLIEIGDILRILDNLGGCEHKVDIDDKIFLEETKNNFKDKTWKLLSILTHEQFSSLEYKI